MTAIKTTPNLSDNALLDEVQRQTFRYFWDFAHPVSGLIRERTDFVATRPDLVTIGGSGMGVMAIIVAAERGFISRDEAAERVLKMVRFLLTAPTYHGVFPHWMNGATGATIPFSRKDDGGDLVETSYLMMGLLTARQYFSRPNPAESEIRSTIDILWGEAEWDWYAKGGHAVLFWHWSPNQGFVLDHEIRGWNECLITYVLAASAPRYPADPRTYHRGWAEARVFENRRSYEGIEVPLGPDYGGPLFFAHYSFMGIDPRGLTDQYADYWRQNVAHSQVNRAYCIRNPQGYAGYGPNCWGLTASETDDGYRAMSPTSDLGVIAPTAAIGSYPYVPDESLAAMRYFYEERGRDLWTEYGFVSSFSDARKWVSPTHIAIDQGPIVCMIENGRSGLLWELFMSCPEVRQGLGLLGFSTKAA
ncbi:glucoamylase family protein [Chelatococcus reniformis]|uniref:Beta-glucosidase n=1 Tax=Chelatococcus reniformis TaxID=1494448 RepID=A0A916TZX6_9HYPH|nr:glucoamylase family protein [Chelatococcus reniformis]GGC54223.1 hypothetical protein GCM10010994_11470 [Chelatococcus reniformis]